VEGAGGGRARCLDRDALVHREDEEDPVLAHSLPRTRPSPVSAAVRCAARSGAWLGGRTNT